MKNLQCIGLSGLFIGLLSQISCVQRPTPGQNLTTLIEAERNFAYTSQTTGMRQAFLTFLSDDAIVFRPRPITGKSLYSQSPTTPGMLTWRPIFADISAAGDLGYTTGPFEFRKSGGAGQPDGYGHFVSLWKKQASGEWRVVLDAGISHKMPDSTRIGSLTLPPRRTAKYKSNAEIDPTGEKTAILDLERQFAQAASVSVGFRAALQSFCAATARIYRNNHLPALNWQAADSILNQEPFLLGWEPPMVEISASGDLAYCYGIAASLASADQAGAQTSFSFLRIWQKQGDRLWKIVLDLAIPIPPEPAP